MIGYFTLNPTSINRLMRPERVPESAGLFLVATWFQWSTLVYSKILPTRFATKIGCFLEQNRAASRTAFNSTFGTFITFFCATRAFPNTKLCYHLARRSCYSGLKKCDGTNNILGTVTKHMRFYINKGSIKINSKKFHVFKLLVSPHSKPKNFEPFLRELKIPMLSCEMTVNGAT